jgi:hypothetical protein
MTVLDRIYWCFFTTTLSFNHYSAIADVHTFQFTVTHTLTTSHILATDLLTGTIISNHYEVLWFLIQSPWTADSPELIPVSVVLGSVLTSNLRNLRRVFYCSRYIDATRTCRKRVARITQKTAPMRLRGVTAHAWMCLVCPLARWLLPSKEL